MIPSVPARISYSYFKLEIQSRLINNNAKAWRTLLIVWPLCTVLTSLLFISFGSFTLYSVETFAKVTSMDKPGMDVCRSKLDLHTSNLDLHRSRLDLCRSKEKRQIWDFGHFATGKNSSFCVQQRLWNSFFKILSFRGCHFAKNCMKIVNFTLLFGPTWVQRWTYIGPDWTHVGPAWTYIDPSQVYPY